MTNQVNEAGNQNRAAVTVATGAAAALPANWQGLAAYAEPIVALCGVFGVAPASLSHACNLPDPLLLRQAVMWLLVTSSGESMAALAKRMPRYDDEGGGIFSHTTLLYAAQRIYHAIKAHDLAIGDEGAFYVARLLRKHPNLPPAPLSHAQASALLHWQGRMRIAAAAAMPKQQAGPPAASTRAAYLQQHHAAALVFVRALFPYITDVEADLVRRVPRRRNIQARKVLMYVLRQRDRLPYQKIGALFDSRHAGNVLRHAAVVEVVRSFDMALATGRRLPSMPPWAKMAEIGAFVGAADGTFRPNVDDLAAALEREHAPELACLRQILPACPSTAELARHSQIYRVSRARAVLIYLIRKNTGKSYKEIGKLFQGALRRPYLYEVTVRHADTKVESVVQAACHHNSPARPAHFRAQTVRHLQTLAVAFSLYGCLRPKNDA